MWTLISSCLQSLYTSTRRSTIILCDDMQKAELLNSSFSLCFNRSHPHSLHAPNPWISPANYTLPLLTHSLYCPCSGAPVVHPRYISHIFIHVGRVTNNGKESMIACKLATKSSDPRSYHLPVFCVNLSMGYATHHAVVTWSTMGFSFWLINSYS